MQCSPRPGARGGGSRGEGASPSPYLLGLSHFQRVLAPYGACFICSAVTWEGGQCLIVWQRRWDAGTGTCPCPAGSPPAPGALHLAARCPEPCAAPCSGGASPGSRCRGFTHARGPGAEPAWRVRERPGAGHDRPATGLCLVGGERGSAVTDSSEHRQQFCDSDAGLAQHQKVTARSTHPGLRGAAALSACPLSRGAAIPRTSPRPAPRHPKSQFTASPAAPALPSALPFPSLCCSGLSSPPPSCSDGGRKAAWEPQRPSPARFAYFLLAPKQDVSQGKRTHRLPSPRMLRAGTAAAAAGGAAAPAPPQARPRTAHSAGKAFFLVVSKFTGFNATDLGPGPVPLLLQQESWRCPGCSRLHKPARFYFFTRISSMSLLSCIIWSHEKKPCEEERGWGNLQSQPWRGNLCQKALQRELGDWLQLLPVAVCLCQPLRRLPSATRRSLSPCVPLSPFIALQAPAGTAHRCCYGCTMRGGLGRSIPAGERLPPARPAAPGTGGAPRRPGTAPAPARQKPQSGFYTVRLAMAVQAAASARSSSSRRAGQLGLGGSQRLRGGPGGAAGR